MRLRSLAVIVSLLSACNGWEYGSGDFAIDLPGGYALVRSNVVDVSISEAAGWRVVGPTIDGYAVVGALVVGHATAPADRSRMEYRDLESGFFILDTTSGRVVEALDRGAWERALAERGVSASLALRRPVREDASQKY